MRLTIQLKRRPYRALLMASLTSAAFSTVLGLTIVSPRATTQWEVSASCSSSVRMCSSEATVETREIRSTVRLYDVQRFGSTFTALSYVLKLKEMLTKYYYTINVIYKPLNQQIFRQINL